MTRFFGSDWEINLVYGDSGGLQNLKSSGLTHFTRFTLQTLARGMSSNTVAFHMHSKGRIGKQAFG